MTKASGVPSDSVSTISPADLVRERQISDDGGAVPRVVFLDARLHDEFDCFDMVESLRNASDAIECVVVLKVLDPFLLRKAINAAVSVMISRNDSIEVYRHALDAAFMGSTFFSHSVKKQIEISNSQDRWLLHDRLSRRELDVLIRIGIGKAGTEIAFELNLSPKTVGTYRQRILGKLGLQNNAEICYFCLRHFPDLIASHLGYLPGAVAEDVNSN